MNDCTVVVNSCDKYSDIWYVFFELFRIHWKDCPYPIILNTEKKSYKHPNMPDDWINVVNSDDFSSLAWTTRLIETLQRINTDYVLLFLDDDLIIDDVDTRRVQQLINWMNSDSNIMCFRDLETGESNKYIPSEKYEGYNLDTRDSFKSSVNIMLYRKSQLLKNLVPGESPWECEGNGMIRSKYWKGEYYSSRNGNQFIPYNSNMFGGYGVWHGKWRENTVKLCEEHNISYDFSKRGVLTNREIAEIRNKEIEHNNKSVLSRIILKLYYFKIRVLNRIHIVLQR